MESLERLLSNNTREADSSFDIEAVSDELKSRHVPMALASFKRLDTIDKLLQQEGNEKGPNCAQQTAQTYKLSTSMEIKIATEGRGGSCWTSTDLSSWLIDATLKTKLQPRLHGKVDSGGSIR